MANRRSRVHDFYSQPALKSLSERAAAASAAATGRFAFHGAALADAVVIRTDLNGYSTWARERQASERAAVLDDFFSKLIPLLGKAGGVYFRDEGDCIVSLFSNYFGAGWSYASAEQYCMLACGNTYGTPQLSAKSVVACGRIAIYQKAHEAGSEDWSAEGDPFVRAGRLEEAVASKPQIVYFGSEYAARFATTNIQTGATAAWTVSFEKLQVPGLGAVGGWTDVVALEKKAAAQPAINPAILASLRRQV